MSEDRQTVRETVRVYWNSLVMIPLEWIKKQRKKRKKRK